MKKLFTALLFVSGALLFSCEDPSEDLFSEIDNINNLPEQELASSEIDHDSGF